MAKDIYYREIMIPPSRNFGAIFGESKIAEFLRQCLNARIGQEQGICF
jgi:hypothetical protein